MTTYTTIANGAIDQDSPVTQTLMQALRDNPTAIAEDASGAPKIARKMKASNSLAATADITGLGDYGGIEFTLLAVEASGTSQEPVNFQYSTDGGSTWSATTKIGEVSDPSESAIVYGYFDFATGKLVSICSGSSLADQFFVNTIVSGASLNIDAVRFSCDSIAAIVKPNGGTE